MTAPDDSLHHHSRPMGGRDPHEPNRVATPLELLFDLTFLTSYRMINNLRDIIPSALCKR